MFLSVFHVAPLTVILLMAVSFSAGVVDAIAGGGGLLNVPSLMLAGLDPVQAVATNKVQGTFGVASSTRSFAKAGLIQWRAIAVPFFCSLIGSGGGALAAQIIPIGALKTGVPFVLIALAMFVALSPKLSDEQSHARLSLPVYSATFAAGIGFYDGVFGPGGGTFFFISLVMMLGQGVLQATANTKALNLASNLGAFALFAFSGHIFWAIGAAMGLSAFVGANIGARVAMKKGARLIKPLVILVSLAMALRLIADPSHPVGAWLRG